MDSVSTPSGGIVDGFEGAVGHTPLIRLRRASEFTGCEILGKAEFMNPGGSVKDRAGLGIILDAERHGRLTPGQPGTIVEGTAGNTGIGITLVAIMQGAYGERELVGHVAGWVGQAGTAFGEQLAAEEAEAA